MVKTQIDSIRTKLKRAEGNYIGQANETLHEGKTKQLKVRADMTRMLGEHLEDVDCSNTMYTAIINLSLSDIVEQLQREGIGRFRKGTIGKYLKQITKDTGYQYRLIDYKTRLYIVK